MTGLLVRRSPNPLASVDNADRARCRGSCVGACTMQQVPCCQLARRDDHTAMRRSSDCSWQHVGPGSKGEATWGAGRVERFWPAGAFASRFRVAGPICCPACLVAGRGRTRERRRPPERASRILRKPCSIRRCWPCYFRHRCLAPDRFACEGVVPCCGDRVPDWLHVGSDVGAPTSLVNLLRRTDHMSIPRWHRSCCSTKLRLQTDLSRVPSRPCTCSRAECGLYAPSVQVAQVPRLCLHQVNVLDSVVRGRRPTNR